MSSVAETDHAGGGAADERAKKLSRAVETYARLLKEQVESDPDWQKQLPGLPDVGDNARPGDHMGAAATLFTIWWTAQGK